MSKSNCSLLFTAITLLTLAACGGGPSVSVGTSTGTSDKGRTSGSGTAGASGTSVETSVSSSTESYRYSFSINGCKTGEQVADSLAGYCKNLANDALNHYCAEEMRKDAFDENCKGIRE